MTEQLTDMQKRRAELEAARAAKLEERRARDEAEAEARAVADLETIEQAEAEHGEIGKMLADIRTPLGVVIIKKPRHAAWRRWQDSKQKNEDADQLVSACVVHPDLVTFRQWVADYPAIMVAAGNLVVRLAGGDMVDSVSK